MGLGRDLVQSAMGGTNRTRVPKMCVRVRLHRKRAATRSRNSGSSEDEESGGDQEGRDSLQRSSMSHVDVVRSSHRLPDSSCLDNERKLQRIATRGVVQLFNAVSKQQKELESRLEEAGPSERKRAKVVSSIDKGSFIDMLKGGTKTRKQATQPLHHIHKPMSEDQQPSWSILRDDYMKGSKFKDWDRQSDSDQSDGSIDDD